MFTSLTQQSPRGSRVGMVTGLCTGLVVTSFVEDRDLRKTEPLQGEAGRMGIHHCRWVWTRLLTDLVLLRLSLIPKTDLRIFNLGDWRAKAEMSGITWLVCKSSAKVPLCVAVEEGTDYIPVSWILAFASACWSSGQRQKEYLPQIEKTQVQKWPSLSG